MQPTLPIFEDEQPQMSTLKLKGTASQRIGALRRGEEFFFMGKAVVTEVNHKDVTKDCILTREHGADLVAVFIVEPEQGEQMLAEAQMMSDERFGIMQLLGAASEGSGDDDLGLGEP